MFPHSFQPNQQTGAQSFPQGLSKHNYQQPTSDPLEEFINRHESNVSLSIKIFLLTYNYYLFSLVNPTFAAKLQGLRGYEIVFICDDSGSMNTPLSK